MGIENFSLFALTALLLNLTPGNDMLFVIAKSSSQGSRAGIIASLGIMVGCLVHLLAAMAGISVLLAESSAAFAAVKYMGAVYLIYLGVKTLMTKGKGPKIQSVEKAFSRSKIFWQAVLTNVLNPKVALFFLAFLPQFIQVRQGNTLFQILFLGIWFDIGGTLVNILVSVLFGRIGKWLAKSSRFIHWQRKFTGGILIALGFKVAFTSKN